MVELIHNPAIPPALVAFVAANPGATPADFDSLDFRSVKQAIKASLHVDQGGLCAYCETLLQPDAGQVDHIKPKCFHPELAFTYNNHAHGCINNQTCGQKKQDNLLPIEPAPHCNDYFSLNTDGHLEPLPNLTRSLRHSVRQTRDMLGLQNAALVRARAQWARNTIKVMQQYPQLVAEFLADKPFRHILRRL